MQLVFRKLWIVLFLCLTSCIQDYDIDFSKSQQILTLNSEISSNEVIKVLLAIPKSPLQHGDYTTPADAIVTVYEEGKLFEVLNYESNNGEQGIYVSTKYPEIGKSYQVEAQYKDFTAIKTAIQQVPASPEVQAIKFDKEFLSLNDDDTISVEIILNDNSLTPRYISVYSYLHVKWWETDSTGYTWLEENKFRIEPFGTENGFRDLFRAWVVTLPESNLIRFNLQMLSTEKWHAENVESMKLVLEINELSKDGYLYRESYRYRDIDNFGEPTLVFSNIENGLGIFSAKSTKIRRIVIK